MRTPLAWYNLTRDPRRLLMAAGGVGFAVLLMFMQIGFRNALFDSTVQLAKLLQADLFLVSAARYNLSSEQRFDRAWVDSARSVPGIQAILPIYIERSSTELRVIGRPGRSIRIVGIPLHGQVFVDEENNRKRELLRDVRSGILDRRTKSVYGLELQNLKRLQQQTIELSGKQLKLVAYTDVGTDFVHEGTIFVSDQAMRNYFPLREPTKDPLSIVDFGLIQLAPGADREAVRDQLNRMSPKELSVLTKDEIIAREIHFWNSSTPIGIIFSIGTVMGLVVGTIICYQILFTSISDHLAEFATLRAMGYGTMYFLRLVLMESVYLTVIGFMPGFAITLSLYFLLSHSTGLILLLNASRIAFVFFLTLAMCVVSGVLAVKKLWSADPASLF